MTLQFRNGVKYIVFIDLNEIRITDLSLTSLINLAHNYYEAYGAVLLLIIINFFQRGQILTAVKKMCKKLSENYSYLKNGGRTYKVVVKILFIKLTFDCVFWIVLFYFTTADLYSSTVIKSSKLKSANVTFKNVPTVFKFFITVLYLQGNNVYVTGSTLCYAGFTLFNLFFEMVNEILNKEILSFNLEQKRLSSQQNLWALKCCEMSDMIDKLAEIQTMLRKYTRCWLNLFQFSILLYMFDIFKEISVIPFFLYVESLATYRLYGQIAVGKLAFNLIEFLFTIIEVIWFLSICQKLKETVRKTPKLLHEIQIEQADSRLKRSVNLFSIQLLQNPIDLNVFHLFSLDYNLLFNMIAVTTGYFIILMQFQLDDSDSK